MFDAKRVQMVLFNWKDWRRYHLVLKVARIWTVDKFCYFDDMIGAGGGAEEASRARVRCSWAKFRELAPISTSRGASIKVKGRVYRACVQRVLVYGSETRPMKAEDMQRLERTERMMVRLMCGAISQEQNIK